MEYASDKDESAESFSSLGSLSAVFFHRKDGSSGTMTSRFNLKILNLGRGV